MTIAAYKNICGESLPMVAWFKLLARRESAYGYMVQVVGQYWRIKTYNSRMLSHMERGGGGICPLVHGSRCGSLTVVYALENKT